VLLSFAISDGRVRDPPATAGHTGVRRARGGASNTRRASGNYIRIANNDVTFYLNDYKTKGQYGAIKNKLSRELSLQIKEYIRINGLGDGDALFGKGKMSDFVSKLVTEAGVRPAGMRGGINVLRRIYISTKVRQGLSETERFEAPAPISCKTARRCLQGIQCVHCSRYRDGFPLNNSQMASQGPKTAGETPTINQSSINFLSATSVRNLVPMA